MCEEVKVEKFQLVRKSRTNKKLSVACNKEIVKDTKILPLAERLNTFEGQQSNTSLIDKNHHTASISDTQFTYDVDLHRQYLLPENPQLFLFFLCIRLVNYIKNMNFACAYLEDIPSTSDS